MKHGRKWWINLVWLSNIRKYHIHHAYQHSVLWRMSSIFNDWDNICTLLCHVNQVSTTSMRKLHSINNSRLQVRRKSSNQVFSINKLFLLRKNYFDGNLRDPIFFFFLIGLRDPINKNILLFYIDHLQGQQCQTHERQWFQKQPQDREPEHHVSSF